MLRVCPLCQSHKPHLQHKKTDPHHGSKDYYLCPNCKLTFLDPKQRLNLNLEKQVYDTHQNNPKDAGYQKFLSKLTTLLEPHLFKNSKGLDFGCGPGPAMNHLLPHQTIQNYDPIYFNDSATLAQNYDFITCTEVIEHVFEPKRTFDQFHGLLNPNGHLGLMTEILKPNTDFESWWYHKDPTHICFYKKETFEWIADNMNWELVELIGNVCILKKKPN